MPQDSTPQPNPNSQKTDLTQEPTQSNANPKTEPPSQNYQELTAKLAAYEIQEKARAEENLKRKGEYSKLITQKDQELAALKKTNTELTTSLKTYEEKTKNQIEQNLNQIPNKADQAFIQKILAGKTLPEQAEILPKLVAKYTLPSDIAVSPKSTSTLKPDHQAALKTAIKTAQDKGDTLQILNLLSKQNHD